MTRLVDERDAAQALVASFKANPNRRFSEQEAKLLLAAAQEDLWAAKAACLHLYKSGALERALEHAMSIVRRENTDENLKNVVLVLQGLGRIPQAIDFIEKNCGAMEPISRCSLLCSLYGRTREVARAVHYGEQALELKDAAVGAASLPDPIVNRFDSSRRARNVISFSLWGNDERYINGAITNTIVARYLYPGWLPRFYIDDSVPQPARQALVKNGAQLVKVKGLPASQYGLFWRFLVEDDPEVDLYIVRDADSVLNIKERWAVSDWLNSGKAFHIMRDNPVHCELILAGMWGASRGNIGGMLERVKKTVQHSGKIANNTTIDQHFLRHVVWPIVRNSVKIHDSCFSFMQPTRYNPDFGLPMPMHIGQNDWVNFRKKRADKS